MADSATPNHNLVLPEVGASKDSWGTKINQNLTKLDTLLKVGLGTFVNRAGDTMTGLLTLPTTNPTAGTHATHKSYVDTQIATRAALAGAVMTGFLSLHADPTAAAHAANKSYVDAQVATRLTQAQGDARYHTLAGGVTVGNGYFEVNSFNTTQYGTGKMQSYYDASTATWVVNGRDAANAAVGITIRSSGAPTSGSDLTNKNYVDAQIATRLTQAQGDARYVNLSGTQNIAGNKVFTDTLYADAGIRIRAATDSQKDVFFVNSDNSHRAVIYVPGSTASLTLASYSGPSTHGSRLEIKENGDINAAIGRFAGSGAGLTSLPAASLTGTINNSRMSGDYSWANLDLTGRLRITNNTWSSPGVICEGATPNILLKQTDGRSGQIGVNGVSFYVLDDANSDGAYETTALQVNLDGSGISYFNSNLARSVTAGNGLSGGGGANSAGAIGISLGTPSSVTGTSGNTLSSTSHTHSLDLGNLPQRTGTTLDADTTPLLLYIDGTTSSTLGRIGPNDLKSKFGLVTEGRSVSAGSGLTGGGDFTTNRSIAMGTPSSITSTSTNSVTSTSHTHSLGAAAVRELMAEHSAGQVGTYGLLERQGTITMEPNDTTAGSNLKWSTADGWVGATPSGTWRLMGRIETSAGDANNVSLWLRIS